MGKIISKNKFTIFLIVLLVLNFSCDNNESQELEVEESITPEMYSETLGLLKDKAKYAPGEEVSFHVDEVRENTVIRYKFLGEVLAEESLSATTWNWTPPIEDFRGYMVELVDIANEDVLGTIAVDVSSNWTKFPRYGFLSSFGNISSENQNEVLNNLKDFHVNGLQYYDWHAKHHIPLPLDANGSPESTWVDLFNREIKFETVNNYINAGHELNMASMFYNLIFGAWHPENGDGFSNEWLAFKDQYHKNSDKHDLGDLGSILVTNPSNQDWQNYIFNKTEDVYSNLNFDGWHLDQLGNRGLLYDYNGYLMDLETGFENFLNNLKTHFPEKKIVLNAVDQYGQYNILKTPVDFAYTEVWSRIQYSDLVQVILENREMSNNQLNTVLAAYMNYDASEGSFNTPSVLLTDAVIFAFGGSHLELGEHMLSREYFPFNNLYMQDDLKNSLKEYYDFMVAYENLLRDGGDFVIPDVSSKSISLNNWPPITGNASVVGKKIDNKTVIQLLNFDGTNTLSWRDNNKIQTKPNAFADFDLSIAVDHSVSKVWFASPDFKGGASKEVEYIQNGNTIQITVPYLEYWSMIVLEQ
ncbi:MAG: glycoside hydrolase family 66 protein [Melioribacteraceae bacterium]|nr:glycoside hydrolase family 66 protein [Melioribacteraceae bacterium]